MSLASPLEVDRRQVIQGRVQAMSIVKVLDIFEDRQGCLGRGFKVIPGQELTFEAGKEALRHSVVEAVTNRPHRGSHDHLFAAVPKRNSGVPDGFNRSWQHFNEGVAMTLKEGGLNHAGRSKLHSPGQPTAGRPVRRQFWLGIYSGLSTVEAALSAGVSWPVGVRWFRESGGMPPSHLKQSAPPLSGRHISFAERERIA